MEELSGCPVDLLSDLGADNEVMAVAQAFFRDDENNQVYASSPLGRLSTTEIVLLGGSIFFW